MKHMHRILFIMGLLISLPYAALAQDGPPIPILPEETNFLAPVADTIYVNTPDTINNGSTESLGVAITSNGDVVVGWEDDGDGLTDLEAVWTLFDNQGNHITPDTTITASDVPGQQITSKFLSFFREDGSAISGKHAWGPKIHANQFGPGFGMGATAFSLGLDRPDLEDINVEDGGEAGDFPAVQLLENDGSPISVLSGVSDEFAETPGDIRIGDWEYLSNGNIVIIGESRQGIDLLDRFDGAATGNHAIYRIVTPQGDEVKEVSLVSEEAVPNEIWHGAASTQNGFAVRFGLGGRTKVRMFDNDGNPTTGNIDIGELTGDEGTTPGGRGDSTGFHGWGDAYVLVNPGDSDTTPGNEVHLTVLNADGTLRFHRVASEGEFVNAGRVDGAIDASGRTVVVWTDVEILGTIRIPVGRVFDADGEPLTDVFYLSENETVDNIVGESRRPRVAWRDNLIATVWESTSYPDTSNRVVALRIFNAEPGTGVENFSLY